MVVRHPTERLNRTGRDYWYADGAILRNLAQALRASRATCWRKAGTGRRQAPRLLPYIASSSYCDMFAPRLSSSSTYSVQATAMSQWTQEAILKLISAYRSRNFLWDKTTQEYTDRNKRNNAWKEVADEVGCDVMTVERKLKSLKTHFMAVHKGYVKRRNKAGLNPSTVVKPKWFAYEALTFLVKARTPRVIRDTMNVEKQQVAPPIIWKTQEISTYRDEFTVFAEHVAIRLKNITDARARLVAQHQINNILFEAEIGKYNINSYDPALMDSLNDSTAPTDQKMMMNLS